MNSFGTHFRYTTFGESHGPTIGVVIDGCPAGIVLTEDAINERLARRAPGQTPYTSPRQEKDRCRLISGVFNNTTTGAPVAILIENKDAESDKYTAISELCRPGHANATYLAKYGIFDYRGGGRASARETAARVAAGAVAEALLAETGLSLFACLTQIGPHKAPGFETMLFNDQGDLSEPFLEEVQNHLPQSPLFAPSAEADALFGEAIDTIKEERDSFGGLVRFFVRNVPQGLGDPVYDKLSARLAFALMSIPATKGFEIGKGFASSSCKGSVFNDTFIQHKTSASCAEGDITTPPACGAIRLGSNNAGGVLGGISTGNTLYGSVAFKPTSSIELPQTSLTLDGEEAVFQLPEGSRHDPCLAIRGVPVVEAMCWVVLADAWLANRLARKKP